MTEREILKHLLLLVDQECRMVEKIYKKLEQTPSVKRRLDKSTAALVYLNKRVEQLNKEEYGDEC